MTLCISHFCISFACLCECACTGIYRCEHFSFDLLCVCVYFAVGQLLTTAKLRAGGSKLEPWVSPQVVAGLDDLGARGIPVHLVYGTSYWDPHTGDFVQIRDDLKPMRQA